jgi:hypothetical protein
MALSSSSLSDERSIISWCTQEGTVACEVELVNKGLHTTSTKDIIEQATFIELLNVVRDDQ